MTYYYYLSKLHVFLAIYTVIKIDQAINNCGFFIQVREDYVEPKSLMDNIWNTPELHQWTEEMHLLVNICINWFRAERQKRVLINQIKFSGTILLIIWFLSIFNSFLFALYF